MRIHLFGSAATILHHLGETVVRLTLSWLRWFWRLSVAAKIAVTATEIVALYLLAHRLPMSAETQHELIDAGSLGLAFLLVFGVLFSSTRPH